MALSPWCLVEVLAWLSEGSWNQLGFGVRPLVSRGKLGPGMTGCPGGSFAVVICTCVYAVFSASEEREGYKLMLWGLAGLDVSLSHDDPAQVRASPRKT